MTYALTLWPAKIADVLGFAVADWIFWGWPGNAHMLTGPLLADTTTVMNLGIMLGAGVAAGLAGRFGQNPPLTRAGALSAVLGGLAMGYVAR